MNSMGATMPTPSLMDGPLPLSATELGHRRQVSEHMGRPETSEFKLKGLVSNSDVLLFQVSQGKNTSIECTSMCRFLMDVEMTRELSFDQCSLRLDNQDPRRRSARNKAAGSIECRGWAEQG